MFEFLRPLKKMEGYLHGASVSYGVLTLLMMDQQFDLFDKIYVFMKKPTSSIVNRHESQYHDRFRSNLR